ncbi:MAG: thioredoxin family protein [Bacteroidetes bacterium]|nr:thioredoxin family protein [Bacteroidota bacterium]MBI3483223.1 thioredoxin family protein [Bacteroidota bacterium]
MKSLVILCFSLMAMALRPEGGYDVGDTVSDFKLKNVDGQMVSLSDFKGAKGFIVIFDCNTCPMSKAYNSRIIELNKKFSSQGFPVIAINPNSAKVSEGESYDKMVAYAKSHNYDFPYLYDDSQETVRKFYPTNTPHVFVLNKISNQLKVAYIGAIDNNSRDGSKADKHYVEDAVNDLLVGKSVATPKTRAIGCSIKWKNS